MTAARDRFLAGIARPLELRDPALPLDSWREPFKLSRGNAMRGSFHGMALAAVMWLVSMFCAGEAEAGFLVGFTNGSDNTVSIGDQTDFFTAPISATRDLTNASGPGLAFARASTESLGVKIEGYQTHGALAEITGLVQFDSTDTTLTQVLVTFSATVDGSVQLNGNAANIEARLGLGSGAPSDHFEVFTASSSGVLFQHQRTALVPLGQPVSFLASIKTEFFPFTSFGPAFGRTDFSNSMSFNPDQFFTLPTGVTANSVGSDWLVGNRLASASAVPEPSSLVLLGTGALSLMGIGWRRARRTGM